MADFLSAIFDRYGSLFIQYIFSYFPLGYQGGRNPDYDTIILFDRGIWDAIHLWSGTGIIIILPFHILVHEKWIITMGRRLV
jgi:hypothetical protein